MDQYLTKGITEFEQQSYPLALDYLRLSQSTSLQYYYYFGLACYYNRYYLEAIGALYQLNDNKAVKEPLIECFLRLNDLDNIVKLYKLRHIDDYINGLTLLFRSVKYRIFDVIKSLLKYGANPYKICDSLFKSPLNYAMIYNDIEIIEIMMFKK